MDFSLFEWVFGILLGGLGARTWILRRRAGRSAAPGGSSHQMHVFLENMRSVGELVVFKAFTKEIVTTAENWLGNIGKRYLTWLMSNMKMAMVFQFEISFWYDLRSPDFQLSFPGGNRVAISMPPCLYHISITDISFYDEQSAKLLDWLLPPLIGRAFTKGFSEEDRNRLKDEAKLQASSMAHQLIRQLSSEIEKSAGQTLGMLARSFGAGEVTLDFSRSRLQEKEGPVITPHPGAIPAGLRIPLQ